MNIFRFHYQPQSVYCRLKGWKGGRGLKGIWGFKGGGMREGL